jgi:hypothetical protein
MADAAEHRLLLIIDQTDRMVTLANNQLNDLNEARWLVHRVMLHAMMVDGAAACDLDAALGRALRTHPANAA